MRTVRPLTFIGLAVALSAACNRPQTKSTSAGTSDPSQIVAKVDDAVITVSDVQDRVNKQSPFVRARFTTPEKKKEFVDSLIRFEVLANEAERRGYDKDPEVLRVMRQQMISKLLQKDFESKLKVEDVPDADVQKYYDDHPNEFNQKDEVRTAQIVVKEKGKADKALAEAKALPKVAAMPTTPGGGGETGFRALVTKFSEDPDAKQSGGDMQFFDKDSTKYPKPIVEAAFKLAEVGDVTQIKTDKGFVVLRLTQKRPGFNRPLAEVKRQIQQRLFRDLRNKSMEAFVADLKKKSKIEIHEENLNKVVVDTATTGGPSAGLPGMPGSPGMPPHGMPPGLSLPGMSPAGAPPPGTPAPRPVPQGKP
jgi:peptidyl-prolyl cis-trans isomerase C